MLPRIKSFSASIPLWLKDKLFQKNKIIKNLKKFLRIFKNNLFSEHHLSHAAEWLLPHHLLRLLLTIDGVGEWSTTTISHGKNNAIKMLEEIKYPHSIGCSSLLYYLGLR